MEGLMSTTRPSNDAATTASLGSVDLGLEVVVIPVSDVDRAKSFYVGLGWRLDADIADGEGFRIVQLTPPGSACSIQFGAGVTTVAPGSAQYLYLVVADAEAARTELISRGAAVGEVFHEGSRGSRFHADGRLDGPAPDGATYATFATFSDPDGNIWLLQEITRRLPGRVAAGDTTFASVGALAGALRRAAAAHGEHEKRIGAADENWPDWYAAYIVAEAGGTELPQ
jgi:catechol 2,3-dioxygenase-like lactoylglutathione lyase family enzyme